MPFEAALRCKYPVSVAPRVNVLVIGAGGTAKAAAYAVNAMQGASLLVHNRTPSKVRVVSLCLR